MKRGRRSLRAGRWLVAGMCLLALAAGAAPPAVPTPIPGQPAGLEPGLQAELAQAPAGAKIAVIVVLHDQANLADLAGLPREARRAQAAESRLRARAAALAPEVEAVLQRRRLARELRLITRFWIFNGLALSASPAAIQELAALPQVAAVYSNTVFTLSSPPVAPAWPAPLVTGATITPEQNLTQIGAPALWDAGYTGQNVVVASLDTGVDGTHPDLAGQWRGGTNSWYDPWGEHPITPTDILTGSFAGHGTEVMGLMVGGSAGGSAIGVAPGAQWIAAKIFNDSTVFSMTLTISATQWLLDPDGNPATADAPQVVNNSWDFPPSCRLDLELTLEALRAAGIVPLFAAGNIVPPSNPYFPGIPPWPANNPAALAVGSVNALDGISSFSYPGPNQCPYSRSALIFPALVAPGENVRTATRNQGYALVSGTSFAAPHVSGALALLISAHPAWTPDQLQWSLLLHAKDLGPGGPDNTYGYGRVDLTGAATWPPLSTYFFPIIFR